MAIMEELKEQTEQEVEEMPAADFFMGIVLMVLSGTVAYVALSWPRPSGIASSAGLFPFLIASSLFIMALSIFIHSFKRKGYAHFAALFGRAHLREAWTQGNLRLALLSLTTVIVYLVVILNLLPFEIGTFLFMTAALYLYWKTRIYKILIVSACVVAFYSLSFKLLFKLILPGAGM